MFAAFVVICDAGAVQSRVLRTLGQNALLAYALHHLILRTIKPLVPDNAAGWYVLLGLAVFLWLNYVILSRLERQRIFLHL